jgi:hypothetical protein
MTAKVGALPSTATRWATTLGVAAGIGLLAGGLLASTRDDASKATVGDHDLVLLAGYEGSTREAVSIGPTVGNADGYPSATAAKLAWETDRKLPKVLVGVEDPRSHRVTLHSLTQYGKPLDRTRHDADGGTIWQDQDGFRDTNPDDGVVKFLTQDIWDGEIGPGFKDTVPNGQTAEQLLGVGPGA